MKTILKIVLIFTTIVLNIQCTQKSTYAKIEGNLTHLPKHINKVYIQTPFRSKEIKIVNGKFSDTLNVAGKFCTLHIGNFSKTLFLENNYQLAIQADVAILSKSLAYTGIGADVNNYLHQREQLTTKVTSQLDSLKKLNKKDFKSYVDKSIIEIKSLLQKYPKINSYVKDTETENLGYFEKNIIQTYKTAHRLTSFYVKGDQSPTFNNLENYQGGKTSLNDLKGNYVYIDIWATWCQPCKVEIPRLQKLANQYKYKNIKFVSISIDKKEDKQQWKKIIKQYNMGGIQLFANNDLRFIEAYEVDGIPKFILLDTEGKIIFPNAPRPSSGEMENIFKYLP